MKTSVLAAFAAFMLTTVAQAQEAPDTTNRLTINCLDLKNKPQVCLVNRTNTQVMDMDCEIPAGWFKSSSTKSVTMPKGGVAPHTMTIVTMNSCKTALILTMAGGQQRRVEHVDTDTMTVIEVPTK